MLLNSSPDNLQKNFLSSGDAYRALRQAIIELYLRPGAFMSIKDICEHFQLGRSPVRDALVRLEQEGLVTLLPQRGTMIALIDLQRVDQERFLRQSVEEEVMKQFMACHTHYDILDLEENIRQQALVLEQPAIDARHFMQLDDDFHGLFYQVTHKEYCLQILRNSSGHYRRMRILCCDRDRVQENVKQHTALVTALQSRDTEAMSDNFRYHLQKLDRDEVTLLKKFPYLFSSDTRNRTALPPLEDDYLSSLQAKKPLKPFKVDTPVYPDLSYKKPLGAQS
jgi:DNA-binding GntR family transcriptional regulator